MKLTRTVQNVQVKKKPAKQVAVENESGMQIRPEKRCKNEKIKSEGGCREKREQESNKSRTS